MPQNERRHVVTVNGPGIEVELTVTVWDPTMTSDLFDYADNAAHDVATYAHKRGEG